DGSQKYSFFAYSTSFLGGVRIAIGDVNGDGTQDIITGPGAGGGPHIRVFDGKTGLVLREFMALAPSFTGGVQIGSADVYHDHYDDILLAAGAGGSSRVKG